MESPLLRVSRPISACARCRNAKIKCDGKLPACSACERAGKSADCSSANDLFAKGKERSYVASLESRVERLEKQISQAKIPFNATSKDQQNFATRSFVCSKGSSQIAEASDVDELVSDFGYLVLNATSTGYNGFDKEMSFARLAISTATIEPLPAFNYINLPTRETATVLVQECIHNVFSVYPVLTETLIYGSLESVYQHNGQYSPPLAIWNIRLVLAISLLLRSGSKGDVDYQSACRHVAIALQQAETVLQPGVTTTTQAVLLLSLYSILDPAHFSSWYLLSIAVRVWIDIGLHQEPAHLKRPLHVVQNHRRLFYCIYSLDRASTFSHVRLFSFTDDAIDVDLPGSPTLLIFRDIDMKANAGQDGDGYFILLIKFRQVTSQHYQKLFGSRRDTLNEPWFNRLQDIVGLQTAYDALTIDSTPSQKDVLGLELHYLIILLLLPLETRTSLDSYGTCLLFDSSISYSRILSRLIQEDRNFMICCTSLEFLRATRVVRYLMSMLRDQSCHIFEETALRKPPSIVDTQLPTVIERSLIESVSAVVGFCAEMKHTLETLQRRFGQWLNYRELMEELGANLQAFRIRERSYQWQPSQENQRDCQPEEQRYDHNSWQLYQEPPHHYGL